MARTEGPDLTGRDPKKKELKTTFNTVSGKREEDNQPEELKHPVQTANVNVDEEDDVLAKYPAKPARIQRGIHMDEDIYKVLLKLKKDHGKGVISDIVNSQVRKYLKQKGYL